MKANIIDQAPLIQRTGRHVILRGRARPIAKLRGIEESSERISEQELYKISGEINWYEAEASKTFALALQYKLEIGRRLMRAKELLPHGKFLSWAQAQFGWTPRHVQSHLTIAQNAKFVSQLPVGTSMRMALAAIQRLHPRAPQAGSIVGLPQATQRIYVIGEIDEGRLDRGDLLRELTSVAARLGAPKTRWKVR